MFVILGFMWDFMSDELINDTVLITKYWLLGRSSLGKLCHCGWDPAIICCKGWNLILGMKWRYHTQLLYVLLASFELVQSSLRYCWSQAYWRCCLRYRYPRCFLYNWREEILILEWISYGNCSILRNWFSRQRTLTRSTIRFDYAPCLSMIISWFMAFNCGSWTGWIVCFDYCGTWGICGNTWCPRKGEYSVQYRYASFLSLVWTLYFILIDSIVIRRMVMSRHFSIAGVNACLTLSLHCTCISPYLQLFLLMFSLCSEVKD